MRLNQAIPLADSRKAAATKRLTDSYHILQKSSLFEGQTREYTPLDADGLQKPPENVRPQAAVVNFVKVAKDLVAQSFDAVLTRDVGNCTAFADIKVEGKILVSKVPVSSLLFLEKRLLEIQAYVDKFPVLDPSFQWKKDEGTGQYFTEPRASHSNEKRQKPIVLIQPTPEHPGQAQLITEEIHVGTWVTTKISTAIPLQEKIELSERIITLMEAVKVAREEANSTEIQKQMMGDAILGFIFG